MVSEFLLPFGRLNLSSLSELSQQDLVERCGLTETEAVEIFEFGKNNQGFWTRADLLKQVKNKALPIAQALYPGYSLFFLFDNSTSHSVYGQDALQAKNMGKGPGGKQAFLRNVSFEEGGIRQKQLMWFSKPNGSQCQKRVQQVLTERGLWPGSGLNLECPKPQCYNCELCTNCKLCVKGTRCNSCKAHKVYTGTLEYTKSRKCDGYVTREEQYIYVSKKHCIKCAKPKGKCGDFEDLPPKCESDRQ